MEESETTSNKPRRPRPQTLAGHLASALNMEEAVSTAIYRDYLDPKNWPEDMSPAAFEKIKAWLNILIEDTKKHAKIITALAKNYGNNQ